MEEISLNCPYHPHLSGALIIKSAKLCINCSGEMSADLCINQKGVKSNEWCLNQLDVKATKLCMLVVCNLILLY